MKTSIEEQLNKALESLDDDFLADTKVQEYERTTQNFRNLVKRGMLKERGNNLMSISDPAYFKTRIVFNYRPLLVDSFMFENPFTLLY